ncbi:MAG: GatB/YqeY domain-containing protein [Proteobacteria bacterium]|nr:GatB/YqeY domain-containing protein [Pseudomonadota bacterium]
MSIEQDLRRKLTAAMKSKDSRTRNVIRMLDTKVMERRTAKDFKGEVDDNLYREVIAAYKKSMSKARAEYEALGERGREKAEELAFEIEFCNQYLPRPLSEDEVRKAVREAIDQLGADSPKMAGRVVGVVMKQHKGRVEAALVKKLATEVLG